MDSKLFVLLFIFSRFIFQVQGGCVLSSPPPWSSQNSIPPVACNQSFLVQWSNGISSGSGVEALFYETISGFYVNTFFTVPINNNTEQNQTITFSCGLNMSLLYQIILSETPYSPTGYTCRTYPFQVTKCGNGVLDQGEECDSLLDSFCLSEVCRCASNTYVIPDTGVCCPFSGCNVTNNLAIYNIFDLSGKTLQISGKISIQNGSTLILNTNSNLITECLDLEIGSKIIMNVSGVKDGDVFNPIKSQNCSIQNLTLDVLGLDSCLYLTEDYKYEGVFNVLEFKISSNSSCSNSTEVKINNIKTIAGIVTGCVLAIVAIVFVVISANKTLRRKVFPWRTNKNSKKNIEAYYSNESDNKILNE